MSLDIVKVISDAFGMMRDRLAALSGIWLLYFVIIAVVFTLFFGGMLAQFTQLAMTDDPTAMGTGVIGSFFLFYILYLLLNFAQSVSLTHQASPTHSPSFGESLTAGFRSIPTLLGLTFILIVAYVIALIPLAILGFIFAFMGDVGSILFAIIVLLAVVWVACRLSLMMPVIAVEGELNPLNAITRSWKLTSGHVLAIFIAFLIFVVAILVAGFLLITIFGGTLTALIDPMGGSAAGIGVAAILGIIIFILFWAALVIFSASFIASLHNVLAGPQTTAETFT